MLKKRIIGVVTVKDGWAVQSFGYKRYLPLGKPECLVENLDRWGADEILVQVIDRSIYNQGPDFGLIERIGALGLDTPLIYGGGIRGVVDGVKVVQAGADRIVIDSILHKDLSQVQELSERLGAQAIIASMPLSRRNGKSEWLDYRSKKSAPIAAEALRIIELGIVSEVLIVDWQHEGKPEAFDRSLVSDFPLLDAKLIVFGGVSSIGLMSGLLQSPNVTAVAVGNFLSYKEHSIQCFKKQLAGLPIRLPVYESK